MDYGIKGKVALVTASSSGLGKASAHALAAEGANVVLFSRTAKVLNATATEIEKQHGVRALAIAGDMRVAADIDRLIEGMKQAFGAPDILVLNTGRPPLTLREVLDETEPERWEDAYRTQLWGGIMVTQKVVPLMLKRGWGRVIAITSASVRQPTPKKGLSTIFKIGINAYMKHLANEIAATGVTVNVVCPANINTPTFRSDFELNARKTRVPMKRLGSVEELAAAVAFYASNGAGFITGTSLVVDGGMNATTF